jgi:hypothetical protein
MSDESKMAIWACGVCSLWVLVMIACAGCSAGTSSSEAPKSRWWQIEAPRDDLECWETQLARGYHEGGQYHVECWPKAPR